MRAGETAAALAAVLAEAAGDAMDAGTQDLEEVRSIQTTLTLTGALAGGRCYAGSLGGRWGGSELTVLATRVDGYGGPPFRSGPAPVLLRTQVKAGLEPLGYGLRPRLGLELTRDVLDGGGLTEQILASLTVRARGLRLAVEGGRRGLGPWEEALLLAGEPVPGLRAESRWSLEALQPFLKSAALTWDLQGPQAWGLQTGASWRLGGEPSGFLSVFHWSARTGMGLKASYSPSGRLFLELGVKLCFAWERRAGGWAGKGAGHGPL